MSQKDLNSINKFNTHLLNFVNELNNIYPSIKKHTVIYQNLNFNNEEHLLLFKKNINLHLDLLINNDPKLIKLELFKNINLSELPLTTQTIETIFKYINVMFIQSFRYNKTKQEINEILRINLNNENDTIEEEKRAFLISIENLKKKNHTQNEHKQENKINENLLNQLPLDNSIMNGSIGKLAMDIAKDIDLSQLDLSNPMEMLQGIMSGDMSKNSSLQNLFGNITSKITTKLNSGEVDTDNILSEAQNIMNKTNKMPFNKELFKNLQKNMPNMPNMDGMPNMPNMEDMVKMMPNFNNLMNQMNTNDNTNLVNNIKQQLEENNSIIEQKKQELHELKDTEENTLTEDDKALIKEKLLKNLKNKKKKYLKKKLKKIMKK